jgi:hypothetical protein
MASACERRGAVDPNGTARSSKSSIFPRRNRRAIGWYVSSTACRRSLADFKYGGHRNR